MIEHWMGLQETETLRMQEQGGFNMDVTERCIRTAISEYGVKLPGAGKEDKCYPARNLASFIRNESKTIGYPQGRSTIYNNITDLTFEGHPSHRFRCVNLPDGQKVIATKEAAARKEAAALKEAAARKEAAALKRAAARQHKQT